MRMAPIHRRKPAAFSLIELLVVVALMFIASTMMYSFGSARRQQSQKALCQDNLQKLYIALQIYAKDYAGQLPQDTNAATSEDVLAVLVPRYAADNSLFICPGGRDAALSPGESLRHAKISYAYYLGRRLDGPDASQAALMSDRQVNTAAKAKGGQVFSLDGAPPGNNHHKYGGNFLMADGTIVGSGPEAVIALPLPDGVRLLNPKP